MEMHSVYAKKVCTRKVLDALLLGQPFFCANPNWGELERGEAEAEIARIRATPAFSATPLIYVPTGGTDGRVRFIGHSKETLFAAGNAQNAALFAARKRECRQQSVPVRSWFFSTLPPWHISGIMPAVRAQVAGGKLIFCDGSFAPEKPLPALPADDAADFCQISLVPTQLRRLLERAGSENAGGEGAGGEGAVWLRNFDCVLLGGAPADAALLKRARDAGIRIALGYGMTETAAFIAWVSPDDFLAAGGAGGGAGDAAGGGAPLVLPPATVLPNAKIEILDTAGAPVTGDAPVVTGAPVAAGVSGRVAISAPWLAPACAPRFITNDEGVLDTAGRLRILGRLDRFIITGGEKVDPRRVEAALLAASAAAGSAGDSAGGEIAEALVTGEPDAEWGERVVALVVLKNKAEPADLFEKPTRLNLPEKFAPLLRRWLAPHCIPKRWLCVPRLPFDAKGKLDRHALETILRPPAHHLTLQLPASRTSAAAHPKASAN